MEAIQTQYVPMGSLNGTNIPCGCENPESSSYVTTKEDEYVCIECGFVVPGQIKIHEYEDKEANEQLFGATFSALFTIMIHISTVIWGEAMKENQWMAGSQQFRELGMIKIWEQLCFLDETARVKSGFFSNSESEKYNLHVERGLQRVDEAKQENDTHWTWTELLFRFFNCEDKAEQQNRLVNVIRTVMKYRTLPNLAKLLGNANVDNVPMEDLVKLPSHEIGHEFFRDSVRQWSVVVKANE
eukprot:gene32698-41596_t